MGTAIAQGNTESLGRSDTDICSELARRNKKGQTQQVRRDDGESLTLVKPVDKRRVVANWPVGRGILQQRPENRGLEVPGLMISDDHFDAQRLGPGFDDGNGLW